MKKSTKTDTKKSDPREFLRVDTVQRVRFITDSMVHGEGFSQNLSEKGCCLFLNQELPEGSLVEITFPRLGSNNHGARIIGRVIWQKEYLSGIKFINQIHS
ncbi:MAG: hypothetical protein GF421_09780 [Candidatus Aminicenantes bacterium]|nr:hypothetical protein [Candidatus Aminicenantes bacterium]